MFPAATRPAACLALLAAAGIAAAAPVPQDVLAGLKDPDAGRRVKALMALSKLGVEAVPHVVPVFKDEDEDVRQGAVVCLVVLRADPAEFLAALRPHQKDESPEVRQGVARVVQQWVLRKKAEPRLALPLIETALADDVAAVRRAAVAALVKCGPDGVPLLKKALADPDVLTRANAATAVKAITPPPDEFLGLLASRLKEETELPVKQTLLDALGAFGERAVPALVAALKEEAPLQLVALKTLARLDKKALPAVRPSLPTVKEVAVTAKEAKVREAALGVVAAFGADGQGVLAEVLAVAKESEPRKEALKALGQQAQSKLPPPREAVVPATAALEDADPEVRALAAFVLGEAGPAAKEALPALKKAEAEAGDYAKVFAVARAKIEGK
jgi:HEAT repeat protein